MDKWIVENDFFQEECIHCEGVQPYIEPTNRIMHVDSIPEMVHKQDCPFSLAVLAGY